MTCKEIILTYINAQEDWVKKVELYVIAEDFSPETVGRKCRELEQEGKINVGYYNGKYTKGLAKYAKSSFVEKKLIRKIIELPDGSRVAVPEYK